MRAYPFKKSFFLKAYKKKNLLLPFSQDAHSYLLSVLPLQGYASVRLCKRPQTIRVLQHLSSLSSGFCFFTEVGCVLVHSRQALHHHGAMSHPAFSVCPSESDFSSVRWRGPMLFLSLHSFLRRACVQSEPRLSL